MLNYAQINENGFLIGVSKLSGNVESENIIPITDEDYSTLFDRFYKPKYEDGEWVEGATPEEIDEIENPVDESSLLMSYIIDVDFRTTLLELGLL